MKKLITSELSELHVLLRKALIIRYYQANRKLPFQEREDVPPVKWSMLIANSINSRSLVLIDKLFNCSADFNRLSKLAVLDVVKLQGFEISMETSGKNMMEVLCVQINVDNILFNLLRNSHKLQLLLNSDKMGISQIGMAKNEESDACLFIHNLIYKSGYNEITQVGSKTFLGLRGNGFGYQLHAGLKKFAMLSVDKYHIDKDADKLQGPGYKIVWGENKPEEWPVNILINQ
jgi:hypothetical protein